MEMPEIPRSRDQFSHLTVLQTRWDDNDVFGHVNNTRYYAFFDTAINNWLISEGGFRPTEGDVLAFCAESHCTYLGSLAYPNPIEVALRVGHLGNSSVRYELAIFRPGDDAPAATGWFVHVFVNREDERPTVMPTAIRDCLQRLQQA